jgi:DNA-binding transcriptional MerR regulator
MNERPPGAEEPGRSAGEKGPDAFRTISEVAEELDLPQHVLRFWETRFSQIRPLKRGGGRRYYRRDDVELLKGIRQLLYGQGYTIKGVQRILKQDGYRFVQAIGRGDSGAAPPPSEEDLDLPGPLGTGADPARTRLAGEGPDAPDRPDTSPGADAFGPKEPVLSPDDIGLLRSALDELLECARVLAALETSADPDADSPA